MWNDLDKAKRNEYKKMILGFASLTEMFAQKAESEEEVILSPIINSKYQETVFQRVFEASAEDIGNTAYDVALKQNINGKEIKYLIGIKTFGIFSGNQKIAQFKGYHDEFSNIINTIKNNAVDENGNPKSKDDIDQANEKLYRELALRIARLRNMRIDSAEANLHGFSICLDTDNVESVYHVLMPSKKGDEPKIYVGETSYDKINTDNIEILGCTKANNPTNFDFYDGNHTYRYTSADSQLLMNFHNKDIVKDIWDVKYADDAYDIFASLGEKILQEKESQAESYSWFITDNDGDMNLFSGFNGFYGVGAKMGFSKMYAQAKKKIPELIDKYSMQISKEHQQKFQEKALKFFSLDAKTDEEKQIKVQYRNEVVSELESINIEELTKTLIPMLFRPMNEMYIPLPNARIFHQKHPDFFGKNIAKMDQKNKLILDKKDRVFKLVFDPSGDEMDAFICQQSGKGIQSYEKQSLMGEWILRKVFQLNSYEPLTAQRLKEVNINGLRLTKYPDNRIHLSFIWIDKDKLPDDYWC